MKVAIAAYVLFSAGGLGLAVATQYEWFEAGSAKAVDSALGLGMFGIVVALMTSGARHARLARLKYQFVPPAGVSVLIALVGFGLYAAVWVLQGMPDETPVGDIFGLTVLGSLIVTTPIASVLGLQLWSLWSEDVKDRNRLVATGLFIALACDVMAGSSEYIFADPTVRFSEIPFFRVMWGIGLAIWLLGIHKHDRASKQLANAKLAENPLHPRMSKYASYSFLAALLPILIVTPIVAVVLGRRALHDMKANPNLLGRGRALTGLTLGWLEIGTGVALIMWTVIS